ncbi:MAG TPA: hypothetical protein VNZ86_12550, partial [Bacteroidia bacterium]|nr:hypothetical protein [Bacteroidia bacterium]
MSAMLTKAFFMTQEFITKEYRSLTQSITCSTKFRMRSHALPLPLVRLHSWPLTLKKMLTSFIQQFVNPFSKTKYGPVLKRFALSACLFVAIAFMPVRI